MTIQNGTRSAVFKIVASAVAALSLVAMAAPATAAGGGAKHPRSGGFSFEGPFGTFDQAQLQRGY